MKSTDKYVDMKDSGVEWVGYVPSDWGLSRIGSLYTLRNEKVSDKDYPPLSVTKKGVVPQLTTVAKTDDGDNRKLVCEGDFVINSRSDRRGSCGISPLDGSVSLINTVLTPINKMNPDYYNWLFHTSLFAGEFFKYGHGIVNDLWTTHWQEMKQIVVPSPPLEVQKRIAIYLNEQCEIIDSLINDAKTSIEEYEKWRKAVIFEAVTKGLNPDVEMKDSGIEWINKIPNHWNMNKIKNGFTLISGSTPKSDRPEYWDGDIVWVTPADYKTNDKYITTSRKLITQDGYQSCVTSIVPIGSIIFSKRAPVGTVAINMVPLCTNQGCISCVPEKFVNSEFFYFSMSVFTEQFELFSSGTTFKEISTTVFSNFQLPFPPISEQNDITEYLNKKCQKIDSLIHDKQTLITELEQYKRSLIYETVTGKRKVV